MLAFVLLRRIAVALGDSDQVTSFFILPLLKRLSLVSFLLLR
jgi:hypothetical protein